jgi:hypothetical protein
MALRISFPVENTMLGVEMAHLQSSGIRREAHVLVPVTQVYFFGKF